ncbi:MAG: hypothetical protein K1W32_13285 [Schaedlerella sp.]
MELEAESLQECGTEAPAEPDPIDSEPESCESTAPPEQNASAEQESPDEQDIPFEQECSPEPDNEPESDNTLESVYAPESECSPEQCTPAGSSSCDGQSPAMEQPPHNGQNPIAEQPSQSQDSSANPTAPTQTVKKIQRSEMSILPRKYWHLANNSFLLHGYHNYHHLLLIEKDGHYWLGVPGIYDPREARAARLFGFPQFTDSYNDSLQLTDDECSPQENFGYWCCFLK